MKATKLNSTRNRKKRCLQALPRLLDYIPAAKRFAASPNRLIDLATRKRGAIARRGPHKGKFVKLTRFFFRVGDAKTYVLSERELRRAKRAGVL